MSIPDFSQPHHLEAEDVRRSIFRKFTPGRHVCNAMQLYWAARDLKAAGVRRMHPKSTEEEIYDRTREFFVGIEVQFREYDYQVIRTTKSYHNGQKEIPDDAD